MKKILTLLLTVAICGLGFTGCTLKKFTSIKTLDVGAPVRALPLTADLNISDQKVRGEAHGTLGSVGDDDRIVREAAARALGQDPPKVEAPDVLVAMNVYKEQRGRDLKVVVTGYPAWYHNFRTANIGGGKSGESDSAWLILTHSGGGGGGYMSVGGAEEQPERMGKLILGKTLKSLGAETGTGGGKGHYFKVSRLIAGSKTMSGEWASLEAGWLRSSGLFYGFDFGGGVVSDAATIGGGFNIGASYDLPNDLHLSGGLSAGFWYGEYRYSYYDEWDDDVGFGGPFVTARWKFIELSYRGLIGTDWLSQFKAGLYFEF
jgi:hypothetical protein